MWQQQQHRHPRHDHNHTGQVSVGKNQPEMEECPSNGPWMEMEDVSSSDSDERGGEKATNPYDGYAPLDEARVEEGGEPQDDLAGDLDLNDQRLAVASFARFLPRGAPSNVLGTPVVEGEGEAGETAAALGFGGRFDEIDFALVSRVASGIRLNKQRGP